MMMSTGRGNALKLPDFDLLSKFYPDYWQYPTPEGVRNMIGGEAKDRDITNTCTIRLSHAMNGSGVQVPKFWQKITNRRGKNGKYYIIRVANFGAWMVNQFGKPDLVFTKKAGDAFDRSQIEGYQGVIAFEIDFSDASGHYDLWYRNTFSHEKTAGKDYFALAAKISLWTGGTRTLQAPV
jgi:hypothetical protein